MYSIVYGRIRLRLTLQMQRVFQIAITNTYKLFYLFKYETISNSKKVANFC